MRENEEENAVFSFWLAQLASCLCHSLSWGKGTLEEKRTLVDVSFWVTEINYRTLKWKLQVQSSTWNMEVNPKVVGEALAIGEVTEAQSVGFKVSRSGRKRREGRGR